MAKIVWDQSGQRQFETGTDHGVLYVADATSPDDPYQTGVAWNGLTSVSESPEGGETNPQYADNIVYLNIVSAERSKGTIEAFTYPKEFAACDGSAMAIEGLYVGQQARKSFGFSYRTVIGNDLDSNAGYKLHLVYGATAAPSEKAYSTINESPEPLTFSWEYSTTPYQIGDGEKYRPTSTLTINSLEVDKTKLGALETVLYGTEAEPARLPLPDEVFQILGASTSGV